MPLIPIVGRRSISLRIIIVSLYIILSIGAFTMVYPFLLMVSISFTSRIDQYDYRIIPKYFYSDEILFSKYLESKYEEDIERFNRYFGTEYSKFDEIYKPVKINQRRIKEYEEFKQLLPDNFKALTPQKSRTNITPEVVYNYRRFLQKKFKNNLRGLNLKYNERYSNWLDVTMPFDYMEERYQPSENIRYYDFIEFKRLQSSKYFRVISLDGEYRYFLKGVYDREIKNINLLQNLPQDKEKAKRWQVFVRKKCPFQFLRIDKSAIDIYQGYLKDIYHDNIKDFNRDYKSNYSDFSEIELPDKIPYEGFPLLHWTEFVGKIIPIELVAVSSPEILYREYLKKRYFSIEEVNKNYNTEYKDFNEISPPYIEAEWSELQKNKWYIRKGFIIRNYREAINYLLVHSRGFFNTAILVIGMLFATLIVNPLCAYALSRFNLPGAYHILLFLIATMAFPAEVTMIPGFLLIKKFGLLNTYWALILPTMANGFFIFLLKGFFDSLPKELYEAATIDGSSEMKIFWHITVPLSKPIIAVISLGTFTTTYGMFMFALLVCQNPKMWTLMVWLYQMSIWAPTYVMFAGLVLAAIPTLLVFIFCQNIIMRGVVLPVET